MAYKKWVLKKLGECIWRPIFKNYKLTFVEEFIKSECVWIPVSNN
jgi:hypothetical protein